MYSENEYKIHGMKLFGYKYAFLEVGGEELSSAAKSPIFA